jgi:4-amino-4-deoxy-L-arabinose transferase-like glycosyltransferase
MPTAVPSRPRSTFLTTLLLWVAFYASFTLFRPALLDDADSVHVEVAREMLLRHDPVTLYANGIRYLEKAPLLYWVMALSMRLAGVAGAHRPELLAAAARLPLALAVLALALLADSLARRMFCSARAGLYASLILLSSFGVFIFTRITIPDAMVCLWITLALYAFWRTELGGAARERVSRDSGTRPFCWLFAASCALNVLTKGLIGVVFPLGIVLLYLWLTRGTRRALRRLRELHPWTSLLVFLALAAPWHIAAGLANPAQGHPAPFVFVRDASSVLPWGHWQVPLPTDGNVRGWWWFYFMNEHLLRYLNLRVPRDYDTVPLALFWGLCLVWLMPWSGFAFKAASWAVPLRSPRWRSQFRRHDLPLQRRGRLLLALWGVFVPLFFSLSTRQEYYILPALPAAAVLIAGWLAYRAVQTPVADAHRRAGRRVTAVLALLGVAAGAVCLFLILHTRKPAPGTDLAQLLQQNPGEYALSFGHFLDLNAGAMGMFRLPLALTAVALGLGFPLAWYLRSRREVHRSNLVLAGATFAFLLAAHLGLQTFAPVLSSARLADAIRPKLGSDDLVVLHGEYEAGSTLGFYLGLPTGYAQGRARKPIHILEGRSSNLWYGSFFPDAPPIFETPESLAAQWNGPRRIFLWQSVTDPPNTLPALPGPAFVIARGGGKEIVSNRRP